MQGYFGERFNRAMCWIDLLLLAEWKEERFFFIRGNKVVVKRGQVATSIKELCQRWGLSNNTVINRLKEMEADGRISINHSRLVNLITIVNYSLYQDCTTELEQICITENAAQSNIFQQLTQSEKQATAQQTAQQICTETAQQTAQPIKNKEEYKEEKKIYKRKTASVFQKPTIEEIKLYIEEKGYAVDAERFYNFYESKGWMIGKNHMKNWHAAVATWQKTENERRNHYGNTQQKREDRCGEAGFKSTCEEDFKTSF